AVDVGFGRSVQTRPVRSPSDVECHRVEHRSIPKEDPRRSRWAPALRRISSRYINTPTTHAPMNDAIAPPTIASNPMRERSWRRLGARVLMPPTWMPTLAKLAKPHRAYNAMRAERAETKLGSAAKRSFISA